MINSHRNNWVCAVIKWNKEHLYILLGSGMQNILLQENKRQGGEKHKHFFLRTERQKKNGNEK